MAKTDTILARALAQATADDQAGLLNSLARELYMSCGGHTGFNNQCCYLASALDKDGEALVQALAEYVNLKKEEIC